MKKLLVRPKTKSKRKSWFERVVSNNEQWKRNRPLIWETLTAKESLDNVLCEVCGDRQAIILCDVCNTNHLCFVCDDIVHLQYPLHDRCSFANGYMQPLVPLEALNESHDVQPVLKVPRLHQPSCEKCGSKQYSKIGEELCIILTCRGRFDLYKYLVRCVDCNHQFDPFELENVLKFEYWPGSPIKVNYLIKEEVFIMWDAFRKRMPGSSAK